VAIANRAPKQETVKIAWLPDPERGFHAPFRKSGAKRKEFPRCLFLLSLLVADTCCWQPQPLFC